MQLEFTYTDWLCFWWCGGVRVDLGLWWDVYWQSSLVVVDLLTGLFFCLCVWVQMGHLIRWVPHLCLYWARSSRP